MGILQMGAHRRRWLELPKRHRLQRIFQEDRQETLFQHTQPPKRKRLLPLKIPHLQVM